MLSGCPVIVDRDPAVARKLLVECNGGNVACRLADSASLIDCHMRRKSNEELTGNILKRLKSFWTGGECARSVCLSTH